MKWGEGAELNNLWTSLFLSSQVVHPSSSSPFGDRGLIECGNRVIIKIYRSVLACSDMFTLANIIDLDRYIEPVQFRLASKEQAGDVLSPRRYVQFLHYFVIHIIILRVFSALFCVVPLVDSKC